MMSQKNINSSVEKALSSLKEDGIELTNDQIRNIKLDIGETLIEVGEIYYKKKDYLKALEWFQKAANGNNELRPHHPLLDRKVWRSKTRSKEDAWCWIGTLYKTGEGVPKNVYTAIGWYTKAANRNYAPGLFILGLLYETENEVEDLQLALEYYKKAKIYGFDDIDFDIKRVIEKGAYQSDEERENTRKKQSKSKQRRNKIELEMGIFNKFEKTTSTSTSTQTCTTLHGENDIESIKKDMKTLEEAFQLQMKNSKIESEKIRKKFDTMEQAHIGRNTILQQQIEFLKEDKVKMNEEIQQLNKILCNFKLILNTAMK